MKALFPLVVCLSCISCLCYQAGAEEFKPDDLSPEASIQDRIEGASQSLPEQTGDSVKRCWPLRTVGIAESAKDYYSSCGSNSNFDKNNTHLNQ